jgi:hypothetical protein
MISYFSSPFMLLNKYFCESVLLPEVTKYLFMFFFLYSLEVYRWSYMLVYMHQ